MSLTQSTYEQERQARIKQNQDFLKQMGLDKFKPQSTVPRAPTKRKPLSTTSTQQRKSRRISGEGAAGDFVSLNDGDDDDLKGSRVPRGYKGLNHGKKVGSKIYDSINGTSCHQCRQKTLNPKVKCTKVWDEVGKDGTVEKRFCTVMMDEECLIGRYGESLEDCLTSGEWVCPKCNGMRSFDQPGNCNCSFCMRKSGKAPTGQLKHKALSLGYASVKEYLAAGKAPVALSPKQKVEAPIKRPRRRAASKRASFKEAELEDSDDEQVSELDNNAKISDEDEEEIEDELVKRTRPRLIFAKK